MLLEGDRMDRNQTHATSRQKATYTPPVLRIHEQLRDFTASGMRHGGDTPPGYGD